MTEDDFERCSLWPVLVRLPQGTGYTLWGSGGNDIDLLLAANERLKAFARWPALVAFVLDGNACNLSDLPGYQQLRELLQRPGNRVPESPREYPIAQVENWLRAAAEEWNAEKKAAALDCLNLLWDAARTLGDGDAQARLRRDQAPLGGLMDALTFGADLTELAAALESGAAAEYSRLLEILSGRWDIA